MPIKAKINIAILWEFTAKWQCLSKFLVQDSFFGIFFGQFEKCIIISEKKRPLQIHCYDFHTVLGS